MTDETIIVIIGILLTIVGVLLLTLRLRKQKETETFGKAASGQMIVLSFFLIFAGLILIIKNL